MQTFKTFSFDIDYNGEKKEITANPHPEPVSETMPLSFEVAINGFPRGKIKLNTNEWQSSDITDQKLVEVIGKHIRDHYE
jgi:hypothetical protein